MEIRLKNPNRTYEFLGTLISLKSKVDNKW